MADIEKVIKGLESCLNNDCHMDKCPYCELVGNEYVCLEDYLMRDALELLKEQEAVKPTWSRGKPYCGSCGLQIRNGGKFCSECGKPIAWEGR